MSLYPFQRLSAEESSKRASLLSPGWEIIDGHHLKKVFEVPSFAKGLDFVNQVGGVAEQMNHHPNVFLSFQQVVLEMYSHKLGGLCFADFELAQQIDQLKKP